LPDDLFIPEIEEDIPLPRNATQALPDLSPADELQMRAATIKLLSDLTGQPLLPSAAGAIEAEDMAKEMAKNPALRPEFGKYKNETLAYLAGMVAQMNCMIVDDLAEMKTYVMNKLVYEAEHAPDSKTRLQALRFLGEIDGVDAFKRRSEMTIQVKPIAEVEQELLTILDNVEYKLIDKQQEPVVEDVHPPEAV